MDRFASIYPFTTENIAGYMKNLDLTNKKVITVTGSADHILNIILKGATDITTFDINPLTKKYMDLKISLIKKLSYEEFLNVLLFEQDLDYNNTNDLDMPKESKDFWFEQIKKYGNKLFTSCLFNIKYYNPNRKLQQNLYLQKENYDSLKTKLDKVKIKFINVSLKDLKLTKNYDYMFLSDILDKNI